MRFCSYVWQLEISHCYHTMVIVRTEIVSTLNITPYWVTLSLFSEVGGDSSTFPCPVIQCMKGKSVQSSIVDVLVPMQYSSSKCISLQCRVQYSAGHCSAECSTVHFITVQSSVQCRSLQCSAQCCVHCSINVCILPTPPHVLPCYLSLITSQALYIYSTLLYCIYTLLYSTVLLCAVLMGRQRRVLSGYLKKH